MKSVGEAMSIGRTFQESVQKAMRSMETGLRANEVVIPGAISEDEGTKAKSTRARSLAP